MQPQGRLTDIAFCPSDGHGCPGCRHPVAGPAIMGSENVLVNNLPALRMGDPGVHASCCGANAWVAMGCSGTVVINGRGAHRVGDLTVHCGGVGTLMVGSHNVLVG